VERLAVIPAAGHELQTFQAVIKMNTCLGCRRQRRIVTVISCALEAHSLTHLLTYLLTYLLSNEPFKFWRAQSISLERLIVSGTVNLVRRWVS